MDIGKTIRAIAAALIILLIGYFYSSEFMKNWASLRGFRFAVDIYFLAAALSFYLLSYLLETYVWQVCINKHLGRQKLGFLQSIAVVNASGLLKYLPGRIWTYTAQLLWLNKYGLSTPVVLHVNLICILGSVAVSLYLGLVYLVLYTKLIPTGMALPAFLVLMALNAAYILWHSSLMNKLLALAGRLLKKEIRPLDDSKALLLFVQLIYAGSWALMGFGGYFLAKGVGLNLLPSSMFVVLASMSLSWVAGYIAVITPGGLGIREGTMLLMLRNIVTTPTALILPIVSRLMYLMSEALLGATALFFGVRYNMFRREKPPSPGQNEDPGGKYGAGG